MTDKWGLLYDLAGLMKKYGPDAFSELARFLRDPRALAELVTIVEAAETAGRRARVRSPRSLKADGTGSRSGVSKLLSELESREPEKAQILSEVYQAFLVREALPNLADLRRFAKDNGLPAVTVTSREKAIGPLLGSLASRRTDDIRAMLRRVRRAVGGSDRTLEGWTDVILGKDRPRGSS